MKNLKGLRNNDGASAHDAGAVPASLVAEHVFSHVMDCVAWECLRKLPKELVAEAWANAAGKFVERN